VFYEFRSLYPERRQLTYESECQCSNIMKMSCDRSEETVSVSGSGFVRSEFKYNYLSLIYSAVNVTYPTLIILGVLRHKNVSLYLLTCDAFLNYLQIHSIKYISTIERLTGY
jgi:hypothetical protein